MRKILGLLFGAFLLTTSVNVFAQVPNDFDMSYSPGDNLTSAEGDPYEFPGIGTFSGGGYVRPPNTIQYIYSPSYNTAQGTACVSYTILAGGSVNRGIYSTAQDTQGSQQQQTSTYQDPSHAVPAGTIQVSCVSMNSSARKAYRDGVITQQLGGTSRYQMNGLNLPYSSASEVVVYDWYFWNRVLSETEVQQASTAMSAPPIPQLSCGSLHDQFHDPQNIPPALNNNGIDGLCENGTNTTVTFTNTRNRTCSDGSSTETCIAYQGGDENYIEIGFGDLCPGLDIFDGDRCLCPNGNVVYPSQECIDYDSGVFGSGGFLDGLGGGLFGGLFDSATSGSGSIQGYIDSTLETIRSVLDFNYTGDGSFVFQMPRVDASGMLYTEDQSIDLSEAENLYTRTSDENYVYITLRTGQEFRFRNNASRKLIEVGLPILFAFMFVGMQLALIAFVILLPTKWLYKKLEEYSFFFFMEYANNDQDHVLSLPLKIGKILAISSITLGVLGIIFSTFSGFMVLFKTTLGSIMQFILRDLLFVDFSMFVIVTIISNGFLVALGAFVAYILIKRFGRLPT